MSLFTKALLVVGAAVLFRNRTKVVSVAKEAVKDLPSDFSKANERLLAREVGMLANKGVQLVLSRSMSDNLDKAKYLDFLSSKAGKAVTNYLMGVVVNATSLAKDSKKVQRLSEELRVSGLKNGQLSVAAFVMDRLLDKK